jgi:DNA-binding NtrC family response regulator
LLAAMSERDASTLHSDRTHAVVERFRLRVVEGPDAGAEQLSSSARLVVGTGDTAGLKLHDRTVSRFHCELAIDDGQISVRDLDSTNGTEIDGVRVQQAWARPGAVLRLGNTRVTVERVDEVDRIALSPRSSFGLLVGASPAMRGVFARLERAAASDATVLVEGETGTGKEATAESLHREGPRADGPFVVVDCAAIPRDLLESELFGHEKGAFTGAVSAREGAFEAAHGGTIFLDEIGELPSDLQPKLLRALERREVKRLGSTQWRTVDVRVIAATNRNLRAEVNAQRFRSDLYYRLAVIQLRLPPLRERQEDLPMLVEHLLRALPGGAEPVGDELLQAVQRHGWPGNVRELRNYLERFVAMRELPLPDDLAAADAPTQAIDATQPIKSERDRWVRAFERRYLAELMRRADGNVTAAARIADVDRIHLYRLLWKHGLK